MLTASNHIFASTASLPEGLPGETTAVAVVFRVILILLAIALLMAGGRLPRLNFGFFFLVVGAAVAWPSLSNHGYGFVLLAAICGSCAGVALFALLPRPLTAISAFWPLPGLYLTYIGMRGGFDINWWLALLLALGGLILAAWLPRLGQVLLACAQGGALLALALPWNLGFWAVLALFGFGAAVQIFLREMATTRRRGFKPNTLQYPDGKRKWLLQHIIRVSITVTAAGLLFCLLIPCLSPRRSPTPERVAALKGKGGLKHPGLLLSVEDSFYLSGRPFPIAMVGEQGGLLSRLTLILVGQSPAKKVRAMRAVKDQNELALMRKAAEITSRAFVDVAPLIGPGANEAELERVILDSFKRNGATGVAFRSVVGSGPNATLPHYQENNARLSSGFVVLDIGCTYNHYASDMTRTFPVSGKYDGAQWQIIQTLASALEGARGAIKPGATMTEIDAKAREIISKAGFGPYFTHAAGHHVGLNVHDPHAEKLAPGMVITVEPGIYIPAGARVGRAYWGLGARVENSYIVTGGGCEEITSYPLVPYYP